MSLIKSGQFDDGIRVLDELLADKLATDQPLAYKVHGLLAETCLLMPQPQLEQALQHNSAVLANPDLSAEDRRGRAAATSRLPRAARSLRRRAQGFGDGSRRRQSPRSGRC